MNLSIALGNAAPTEAPGEGVFRACPPSAPGPAAQRQSTSNNPQSTIGFTLVELLVVIAIISVLAGLLLPVLEETIASARAIDCQNRLRQIGTASLMYTDEWDGVLLQERWAPSGNPGRQYECVRLRPYLGDTVGARTGSDKNVNNIAMCPAFVARTNPVTPHIARIDVWMMNTYTVNSLLEWAYNGDASRTDRGWHVGRMIRLSEIRKPSQEVYWHEYRKGSECVGWYDGPGAPCKANECQYNQEHNDTWPTLHYDSHVESWQKTDWHFTTNSDGQLWYGGSWFNLPSVNAPVYTTFSVYLYANTK